MIYIKEVLPNPSGDENTQEWIRLINDSDAVVDATGWQLVDKAGQSYSLSILGEVLPGETVEIRREASGIALNNNGDELYLIDIGGNRVDELVYQNTVEDEIIVANRFATNQEVPVGNLENLPPSLTDTPAPAFAGALTLALVLALAAAGIGWRLALAIGKRENENIPDQERQGN